MTRNWSEDIKAITRREDTDVTQIDLATNFRAAAIYYDGLKVEIVNDANGRPSVSVIAEDNDVTVLTNGEVNVSNGVSDGKNSCSNWMRRLPLKCDHS